MKPKITGGTVIRVTQIEDRTALSRSVESVYMWYFAYNGRDYAVTIGRPWHA